MSGISFLKTHRPWEDWVGMLIGVLIGISPWFAEHQYDQAVIWNAVWSACLCSVLRSSPERDPITADKADGGGQVRTVRSRSGFAAAF